MIIYSCWEEMYKEYCRNSTKNNQSIIPLEDANIFYSPQYEMFERNRGNQCFYVFNKTAIILLVVWKKYIFKWGSFPSEPFYYNQGFIITEEYERTLLDDVIDCVVPKYAFWIGASGTAANFRSYPSKSLRIPFGNYIVDFDYTEEELFSRVTSKCRNMIRRAMRDGVIIKKGGIELLDQYLTVDKSTWERSGINKNYRKQYINILETLKDHANIYVAEKDNEIQGGAIFIYSKAMSFYLYGASADHPSPGALNLLQWQAMMDFKRMGVKKHNFVGCRINEDPDSKYHGIQKFKSSFGGELVQGYMFKTNMNSAMYQLFKHLITIKDRGKVSQGDIIDQEIHKWIDLNK